MRSRGLDESPKPIASTPWCFSMSFKRSGVPNQAYGDADRLTKRTRAIFQRSTGVSYLFTGSLEHLMRDLFTPSHRALHQFGGFHDLRPIEDEAWMKGLAERFAADDCELHAQVLARIIEYGEGQPRSTMLIAQKSHLTTVELATRLVDLPSSSKACSRRWPPTA